jgi:hypothetical protein
MMQQSKTSEVVRGQRKECKFGLAGFPAVFAYYETDWDKGGLHWAAFGMEDVTKLASGSNNVLEPFNRALKYIFVRGREHYRLQEHINMLGV